MWENASYTFKKHFLSPTPPYAPAMTLRKAPSDVLDWTKTETLPAVYNQAQSVPADVSGFLLSPAEPQLTGRTVSKKYLWL